jgi:flagellar basal-body rod protein FlgG
MAKSLQFSLQRKMQNISHNIANIMSPGYKRKVCEMESMLPLAFEAYLEEFEKPGELRKKKTVYQEYGTAVRIIEVWRDFNPGAVEVTNRPLDIAIENGKGLFQYRLPNGSIAYSRAGNLQVDSEGFLVDPNGHPLEPAIQIPREAENLMINKNGQVFIQLFNEPYQRNIGQIRLAVFNHPEHLRSVSQNLYSLTPLAGEPTTVIPGDENSGFIRQNSLEYSNVNIMEEMVDMLLTQRMFQLVVGAQNGLIDMLKAACELKA